MSVSQKNVRIYCNLIFVEYEPYQYLFQMDILILNHRYSEFAISIAVAKKSSVTRDITPDLRMKFKLH
jgi:hypothetical protein